MSFTARISLIRPGCHSDNSSIKRKPLYLYARSPLPAAEDIGAAFNARSALQLGGGVAKLSALNPNHPW
jgi:hypothetical protein